MRRFVFIIINIFLFIMTNAQPSEADIRKQLTNEGTKTIKFTKSSGTRQWNKDIGNWEYVRGVEVIRKSEYPGIDLVVVGDAVYQYTGSGQYSYWKFRTISNQYLGIPNPTAKEIKEIVGSDWSKFYGYYFQKITKEYFEPSLADNPNWFWHSPNSVEFNMKLKFDHIISNTEVETVETIWDVRLYRNAPKEQWNNFIATRSQEAADSKIIAVQKFSPEQIKDLEKQTLEYTLNEQTAKLQAGVLPKLNIPSFSTAEDLVKFVHNILRNGNPEQFRAVVLQLFAPGFFVNGSNVQLTAVEEQNLADVILAAYKNKVTYKQLYCQNPEYRVETWGDGNRKTIYITGAVNNCNTSFTVGSVVTGYRDGEQLTAFKILQYGIYVRQDQDAINFINSFSTRNKMCLGD